MELTILRGKKLLIRFQVMWLAVVVGTLITISSCSDDPSAEEAFLKKVSLAWKSSPSGVQFDGKDVNGVFKDFTITFTESQTYSTTSGNSPVWASSGKFSVKTSSSATGFSLIRDDGVEIVVDQLTDTKLVLKFSYIGKTSRVKSVSGGFVFDLVVK